MSAFSHSIDNTTFLRLKQRKQAACRQVYNQFATPVYNLAYRMLQNPEDAQDISQISFITAFNKIEQWSGQVAFGFWLRRIVINHALDLIKNNSRESQDSVSTDNEQQLTLLQDSKSFNYEHSHDANHYLKNLSPVMRSILWLYVVEGFTHQEIGHLFNRSESFSKSRVARAKQQLHQLVNKQTEQGNRYEQSI